MIKKSIGVALLATSMLVMGCSSKDDTPSTPAADAGATDTGATDTGATDTGATDTGATDTGATDTGATDTGATDTGGTDAGGPGTDSGYPAGSLADVVFVDGRATNALAAMKTAGFDLALDDTKNTWTVFLPTNEALADFTGTVDLRSHIYDVTPQDSTALTGMVGSELAMNNQTSVAIGGGGTEALTIGTFEVVGADLTGNVSTTIVHIIDGVLPAAAQ